MCSEAVTGTLAATRAVFNLPCLPCFRGKASTFMLLTSGLQPSTALLVVPVALQPAQGAHLPCVGPRNWGAQFVARTSHTPGRVSARVISLFLWVPSRQSTGANLIAFLLFLPDYLWIFLAALVVQESFCQFPVSFQWELFHMQMYFFDVFVEGGEFHVLLLCHLDQFPQRFIIFFYHDACPWRFGWALCLSGTEADEAPFLYMLSWLLGQRKKNMRVCFVALKASTRNDT